jgi:hypothetical protein
MPGDGISKPNISSGDGFIKKDNLTIHCQGATPIRSIQRSVVWLMHNARLDPISSERQQPYE